MRIGGLGLLTMHRSGGVRGGWFEVASWHNPRRDMWAWLCHADCVVSDERRAVRVYHFGGFQSSVVLQLWAVNIRFMWQRPSLLSPPTKE
jgi:hypothetical protein